MEDKVKDLIGNSLDELDLFVDSVSLEKEDNNLTLKICLDSKNIINLEMIVAATKIIDPIITKANLIDEFYVLDVYGKSKGSGSYEC